MIPTGLTLSGLSAAYERRRGGFQPVLLDAAGVVVLAGEWERITGDDRMSGRAEALLRRHLRERGA